MPFQYLLLCILPISDAASILAFFPMSHPSHHNTVQPLLKGLALKGHQITYVTSRPMKDPHGNIKEIFVGDVNANEKTSEPDYSILRHQSLFGQSPMIWGIWLKKFETIFYKPVIQDFVQKKRRFDVIIAEIFHYQESFVGLAEVFKAPIVDFSTNCGNYYHHNFLLNPNVYSYVTGWTTPFSDRMTLHQRLMNTLVGLFEVYGSLWYYLPLQEEILYSNFNISNSGQKKESIQTLLQNNVAATIMNSDSVLGYPRPLMPNTIHVAGITLQPKKPLPQDLQKFMDEAEAGVIYFSLGTLLNWGHLGTKQMESFVQAFSRLPQRVIWKYNGDLGIKSPNILTRKWFPQKDILAHPNCRLFITHGGYLSLVETVNAGVPVIVIPFFADQPRNAHLAQAKGFGMHLNFDEITPDSIFDAVQGIIGNKSYSDNAKKISALFNDHVVSPLDKAVHLVEYVIRHKGHPASQTGAKELSWLQYFLLDVIAIILTIVLAIFIIMFKIIRIVLSLLCSESTVSKKKSSNSTKKTK